jgi:hypothetical protein
VTAVQPTPTAAAPAGLRRPVHGRAPGPVGQVAALVALRVSALRGRARVRAAAGAAVLPGVAVAAVLTAVLYPREHVETLVLLMPSAWLFFLIGAIVAAATGAGGRQLMPPEQAVAFPVSPAADQLGAIVTAPLNVAWSVQAMTLLALTSWAVGPTPGLALALALTVAWIVCCTVVAQAAGWLVELARTTAAGVWAVRLLVAASGLAAAAVAVTGRITTALDAAPTRDVVVAALAAGGGRNLGTYAAYLALVAGVTALAWWVGTLLAGLLQRRPALVQARGETRRWPRRPVAPTALRANLRVDRAAVWRSAPLRRGIVALGVIPGAAAAASGLTWPMVALLPGLVASGAGLLFGVNAFSLDGPGALWRETLPGPPRTMLAARLLVVAEVCVAGALVALVAAALRAGPPTRSQLIVVLAALVATTAQVVARCARWSVGRPYAAALREARDQPAPPAAMAGYSARLAVSTTFTGIVYTLLAQAGLTLTAVLLTCSFVLVAGRRLTVVARQWDDHPTRLRVLATVAGSRA